MSMVRIKINMQINLGIRVRLPHWIAALAWLTSRV